MSQAREESSPSPIRSGDYRNPAPLSGLGRDLRIPSAEGGMGGGAIGELARRSSDGEGDNVLQQGPASANRGREGYNRGYNYTEDNLPRGCSSFNYEQRYQLSDERERRDGQSPRGESGHYYRPATPSGEIMFRYEQPTMRSRFDREYGGEDREEGEQFECSPERRYLDKLPRKNVEFAPEDFISEKRNKFKDSARSRMRSLSRSLKDLQITDNEDNSEYLSEKKYSPFETRQHNRYRDSTFQHARSHEYVPRREVKIHRSSHDKSDKYDKNKHEARKYGRDVRHYDRNKYKKFNRKNDNPRKQPGREKAARIKFHGSERTGGDTSMSSDSEESTCGSYNKRRDNETSLRPWRSSKVKKRGVDTIESESNSSETDFTDHSSTESDYEIENYMHKRSHSRGKNHNQGRFKTIFPDKFDGSGSFAAFMNQFRTCSHYNKWGKRDKMAHIKILLRGNAALLVANNCPRNATYKEVVKILQQRYANEEQHLIYRTQLKNRRRKKGETLQALYDDICRLAALAFSGDESKYKDLIIMDCFIDSLDDPLLEAKVRERDPLTIDEVFRIALRLESYERSRSIKQTDDDRDKFGGRARATKIEKSTDPETTIIKKEEMEKNISEIKNEIESLKQRIDKISQTQTQRQVSFRDDPPRNNFRNQDELRWGSSENYLDRACFICKSKDHFQRECPNKIARGNFVRRTTSQNSYRRSTPPQWNSNYKFYDHGTADYANNNWQHNPQEFAYDNWSRHQYHIPSPVASNYENNVGIVNLVKADEIYVAEQIEREKDVISDNKNELLCNKAIYIKAEIDEIENLFLLDTGSDCSILPAKMVNPTKIERVDRYLLAANGTKIPILGEAILNLKINGTYIPTQFLISRHVIEPILSSAWLQLNSCIWNFKEEIIYINDQPVQLHSKNHTTCCRRLTSARDTSIPPMCQKQIMTKLEVHNIHENAAGLWVTNGGEKSIEGLLIPHTLTPNRSYSKIEEGEIMAELEPAELITENVEENLECGEFSHIQPLLNSLLSSITEDQRNALKRLLVEYANVFSRHNFDPGEANAVLHSIKTGDAKPVRQPLRKQPRDMLDEIDDYTDKLLEAEAIEKAVSPWATNIKPYMGEPPETWLSDEEWETEGEGEANYILPEPDLGESNEALPPVVISTTEDQQLDVNDSITTRRGKYTENASDDRITMRKGGSGRGTQYDTSEVGEGRPRREITKPVRYR